MDKQETCPHEKHAACARILQGCDDSVRLFISFFFFFKDESEECDLALVRPCSPADKLLCFYDCVFYDGCRESLPQHIYLLTS